VVCVAAGDSPAALDFDLQGVTLPTSST